MNKQTKYASTILISILVCAAMVFSRGINNTAEAFQNNVAEGYEGCLPANYIPVETVIKDNENLLPASGGGRGIAYTQPLRGTITKLFISEENSEENGDYVRERMYIQSRNASILVYSDYFSSSSPIGIGVSGGLSVGNVIDITGGFQCVNYNGKFELAEIRNANNEILSNPLLTVVFDSNQSPVEIFELTGDIWAERTNSASSNYFSTGDFGRHVSFDGLTVTSASSNNIAFTTKDSKQNSVEVAAYVEGIVNPTYRTSVVNKLAGAMDPDETVNLDCVLSRYQINGSSTYSVQLSINLLEDITVVSAPVEDSVELTVLGVNDFHGAVKESDQNPGIVKLGGAIKAYDKSSTIVISGGDMFQGSLESNYNYGRLVTEAMTNIGFDAMAIGNHEFDWGADKITANKAYSGFPFLGANIYDYDMSSSTPLGDFSGDPLSKYTIVEKEGVRVGIIGTIGEDQITSISSQFVDMYSFIDPIPVIKELSNQLRDEEECDVIIVDHHGGQEELLETGLTSVSPVTNRRYIDLAMCAHSHQNQSSWESGVYFMQTAGYGKSLAKAVINVTENSVSYVQDQCTTNESSFGSVDSTLNSLVQSYTNITDSLSTDRLAHVSGGYGLAKEEISNLYNKAMYQAAQAVDSGVLMAIGNNARTSLAVSDGYITFGTLYNSLPFDNEVIIGDVSGEDLLYQLGSASNYAYSPTGFRGIDSSGTYRIAVLDYVGLHRNSNREYDYMPSLRVVTIVSGTNYREITKTYLLSNYYNNNNAYLDPNDYSSTEFGFNKSS